MVNFSRMFLRILCKLNPSGVKHAGEKLVNHANCEVERVWTV